MAIGSTSATSAIFFPQAPPVLPPKPPPKALGRSTRRTFKLPQSERAGTPSTAAAVFARPSLRLPKVDSPAPSPVFQYANTPSVCVEPPEKGTYADGRPKRDLVAVSAYLKCLDRQRASAGASPPIVPGSPVMVPAGLVSAPPDAYPAPPPAAPPIYSSGGGVDSAAASAVASAVSDAAAPASVVASTFGASVNAPDWAWIAGGVIVAGVLGFMLHKKGVF